MTIALSVGEEHFQLSHPVIGFQFNPQWTLYNNRANRQAVISKFTTPIDGGDFIIVERTIVQDKECRSESFIFEGAVFKKLPVCDFKFLDESRQQHKVDGLWHCIGDINYRLRYILVTSLHRQRIHTQPFSGATFLDAMVVDTIVKELSYTRTIERLNLDHDRLTMMAVAKKGQ